MKQRKRESMPDSESQTFTITTHPALLPLAGGMVGRAEHDQVVAERDDLRSQLGTERRKPENNVGSPNRIPHNMDGPNRVPPAPCPLCAPEGEHAANGHARIMIPAISDEEANEIWKSCLLDARHD